MCSSEVTTYRIVSVFRRRLYVRDILHRDETKPSGRWQEHLGIFY